MNVGLLYLKFDKKMKDGSVAYGVAFPSDSEQVVLSTYTYEAKRMGGAPTISDSFYFPRCLDNEWKQDGCSEVYAEYNNEKFFVSSIPSPTKDNASGLYKHEITLTSRREILDNTLFFDVVTEHTDTQDKDRYRSNQTKFSFGGDIREFIKRINDSLVYVGIYDPTKEEGKQGYHLALKDGYGTDEVKEISIDNQYITEVIQEIYNTYNLTYYWKGEVCYVGEYENDLTGEEDIVRYGRNEALLSVSEENSNNKIIDMITGYGSSDNIPYYYPNDDEFGEAVFETENINKAQVGVQLSKVIKCLGNTNCYNNKLSLYKIPEAEEITKNLDYNKDFSISSYGGNTGHGTETELTFYETTKVFIEAKSNTTIDFSSLGVKAVYKGSGLYNQYNLVKEQGTPKITIAYYNRTTDGEEKILVTNVEVGTTALLEIVTDGIYEFCIRYSVTYISSSYRTKDPTTGITVLNYAGRSDFEITKSGGAKILYKPNINGFVFKDSINNKFYNKDILGITLSNVQVNNYGVVRYELQSEFNDKVKSKVFSLRLSEDLSVEKQIAILITDRVWITPTQNLMPSIYRNTQGVERFYYATDTPPEGYEDIYKVPGTDKNYTFKNKYTKGNPHQGSVSFDDIKPTINGIRNDVIQSDGLGQLFGEIADVAFDSKDSDVKDSNDEYVHQYFYIKLHKFSGEFGFDLFSHALAKEHAVINMIDCQGCPACAFPIKTQPNADNSKMFNCVSTDGNGNLVSLNTEKDDYILGETAAQSDKLNQNSQEKEIWIAVQKDNSTLGIVMPNAAGNFKPKKGDKFVITGIKPPKVLVTAAEHRLDEALIKYMSENNEDQFDYSVKFSRIFFAEHENFADKLNENAKICLEFNNIKHELFISSFLTKCDNSILTEVEVELVRSLEITQSEIKEMIDSVKDDTISTITGLNTGANKSFNAAIADRLYISKLKDDTAEGLITFLQGLVAKGRIDAYNGMNLGRDGIHYLDGTGSGVLGDVIVDRLHDKDSTPSDRVIVGAQGFDLYMGNDGKSHLYVDYLTTRTKMFASSLEIRKVSYSGGTTIFSNAGSEICKVSYIWSEDKASVIAYKCYSVADDGTTKTMNWWHVGMMALCQTFNVKAGETSNAANRYYWRMVVGVGQEKLEDGKLYDYVILSNQRVFQGNAAVIPSFTQGVIGDDKPLVFGNVMVQVVNQNSMKTMAQLFQEQEDKTTDDGGTQIASRLFYGYESVDGGEEQEPDAPQPLDVIVQVGDQIQWKKYGNLIKLSTSVEDNATENAPAITMYHNLGAPYTTGKKDDDGNDMISPFQWKTITTIISPEKVMHNADNFILFQGTPDNIVDPIVISYDIIPTTNYMTRHPQTLSTTPANIGFRLRKRSGNKTEWIDDAKIYADYTDIDNVEHKNVLLSTNNLSDLGNAYNILAATIHTTIKVKDQEDELVTFDLPVLTDGVKGDDGTNGKDGVNGKDGAKGEKGDKGDKGDDGVGIKTADVIYCVSDSETTQPSDTAAWKTLFSELTLLPNKYVWSCTKVTLTNGISTYSGKQCLGKCEDFISITEQYALGDSQTQAPTSGWGTSYTPTKEKWLWSRSEMAWSNGSKTYTTPICTGYFSKDGTNGKNGNYTEYFFAISASKTTSSSSVAPSDIQAWQTTAQIPTEAKPYVWMQVRKVENDKVVSTSYVRVNGEDGENGKDGKDGKNGVDGTDGAYTSYDYNIAKQNVSYSTATFYYSKWQDAPMEVTKDYPFLWMRMTRKNDPNDNSITYVCLTGAKGEQGIQGLQGLQGDKGEQGIPGKDGTNGSTTYFHIKYSSYENPTSASQMTETPSTYIGTYVDFTQADSTDPKKYTWARFQGIQGDKGDKGIPGTNGIDGKTSYLHIKYSNDGGKTFTSNSGEDVGEYIGTCVDNNVNDPTSVSSYTWAKIKGTDGTDGVGIASVEEHYQVSSSNTTAPTTWQSSVPAMTETNKYLWNYETIHYTNGTTADSNKRVIGVYGDSGVGIKSVVNYYLATSASSGVTTSTSGWTTTIQAISSTNKYLWNYEVVEYTNGKNTTTTPCIIGTYGRDGKDGTNGTNGTNGEDAINIYVEGAPLVFDTADDGVVVASDAKSAKIYIFQKGVNQTSKALNVSLLKDKCVNLNTADVSKTSNYIEVTIKGGAIQKDALTVDGTTDYVSKATGYAVVQFSFGSVMYQRQIVFNVNVARYTHTMKQTSKELESKYTEVSKSLDDVSSDLLDVTDMANRTDEDYRKFESTFEQNAREIAMSVTSETVGRRNLLLGSDFRQQDGFWLNNAGIEINSGYKGINCVHAISSGSSVYAGVYWHANNSYPSLKNIPIVVGKKYTLSCWVKCSSTTAKIRLNATYAKTASQTDFSGMKSENNQVQVDAANEWQLVNVTFSPTDSSYPYAAIAIFTTGANLYVCMPMLEEGEVVNPWTLHKEDYNFVGGNMLDNTRWLTEDQNNNPSFAPAAKYLDYDSGRQAVFTNTVGANQRALKVLTTDMKTGQDYILSFLCKCDVSYMVTAGFSNSAYDVFAEDWQGGKYSKQTTSSTSTTLIVSTMRNARSDTYERVWVHLRFNGSLPTSVQVLTKSGTIYIAQPKLEECCCLTEWTERKSDFVDENRLRKTGISITDGTITLNADNTIISGDLHLRGVLVESYGIPVQESSSGYPIPIICDMVQNKSISLTSYGITNTKPSLLSDSLRPYVVLPMITDTAISKTDGHNEMVVKGVKESGVKLTIASRYNPLVAKWATAEKKNYADKSSMPHFTNTTPYAVLHQSAITIFADPRLASADNYNPDNAAGTSIRPEGCGEPPYYGNTKYNGGCFVCNGRRGRILLLMPGQTLHLTSAVETIGNNDVLVWYVDNGNDFVPIRKSVRLVCQQYETEMAYDWTNTEDESFPDDGLDASEGYNYEDVLFAPPQLSNDYPIYKDWEKPSSYYANVASKVQFVQYIY